MLYVLLQVPVVAFRIVNYVRGEPELSNKDFLSRAISQTEITLRSIFILYFLIIYGIFLSQVSYFAEKKCALQENGRLTLFNVAILTLIIVISLMNLIE